jgi:signal transduction histidine kinase
VGGTSLGLLGMEERTALAGGSLELRTAPGQGTILLATFPL